MVEHSRFAEELNAIIAKQRAHPDYDRLLRDVRRVSVHHENEAIILENRMIAEASVAL